jgi:hypothetical protein
MKTKKYTKNCLSFTASKKQLMPRVSDPPSSAGNARPTPIDAISATGRERNPSS